MRVSDETRQRFARLADTTGRPMTQLLDEAVDALERRLFFDLLSARYAELRRDTGAWTEIETERDTESQVLGDRSA
jgi:predicted transcriptional regulator